MQQPIILLSRVSRRFGHRYAVQGIDLQLPAGKMLGLVGPNGSGKTTLLKLMAGFIKPTSGTIRLFGHDPYRQRPHIILLGQTTDALLNEETANVKILAGDLNLDVDLDKRRDLFTDDEYLDVETYNYIVQHLSDATLNTGSTAEPDRRLDYIFVEPKHVNVTHSGPWKGQRIANMDHDPVVANLKFVE